jgi:hypothetical protein
MTIWSYHDVYYLVVPMVIVIVVVRQHKSSNDSLYDEDPGRWSHFLKL